MASAEAEVPYAGNGHAESGLEEPHISEDIEQSLPLADDMQPDDQLHGELSAQNDDRSASLSPLKPPPYRDPLPKPNKVYIGNLPDNTREEDLQECFSKIGPIVSIELKVGYGFVEFETIEAAEESVAKYHEGMFLGNRIKVEVSRGRKPPPKVNPESGACFKCGQHGHWARECPNFHQQPHYNSHHGPGGGGYNGPANRGAPGHRGSDSSLDRREYLPPPRDYPPGGPRDEYVPGRPAPSNRYGYDYAAPARDAPPRDSRDYYPPGGAAARPPPPGPPRGRDFDDYGRRDYRGPPAPPAQYDARPFYPEYDRDPGYARPAYSGPPNTRDGNFDRLYDRRGPPPPDRFGPPGAVIPRARTPPGPPPLRGREPYPPRDYPPAPGDYRRPPSPGLGTGGGPRYDYPPRRPDQAPYRRRSQSPPPRGQNAPHYRGYAPDSANVPGGFGPPSDRPPYGAPFAGNGYAAPPAGPMPPVGGPPRGNIGRRPDDRDFGPRGPAPDYVRRP